MKHLIFFLALNATTFFSIAATITSNGSGDWLTPGTWDLNRIPADDDVVIIDTGHTVEISGDDITLDNVQVIIRGTLLFDDDFIILLQLQPSLTLTGANSGILIADGGMIDEDVQNFNVLGVNTESLAFISVNGIPVWNACSFQACIDDTNDFLDGIGLPDLEQAGDVSGGAGGILLPNSNNPLPVEFLFFTAQYESKTVMLEWATATEVTNSHFEIERSWDGNSFEKIGEVTGAGDSQERIDYQYIDYEAAVSAEIIYYRLRQVDYDGKFDYSNTVIARNSDYEPLELLVRPTLFRDRVTVTLNATEQTDNVNIEIYDLQGNKVYSREEFLYTGINDFDLEDIYHLSEGAYLLSLTSNTFKLSQRIVKAN